MTPQSTFLSFWILAGLVFSGCNESSTSLGGDPQSRLALQSLSPGEQQAVSQDLGFGLKLLSALSDDSGASNLLISPLSLSIALTMAYNGARGETEAAMRATLGHGDMARESLNALYGKLLPALAKADAHVRLTLASSLWSQKGWEIASEFRDLNRLAFDAETREIEFQSPEAASLINGWAREKTQGLIKEIVEPSLGSHIRLMLLNALTFKGAWSRPFDHKATGSAPFRKEDGTEASVAMMNALGNFRCFEQDGVRGLDLPYGDSLFSMVFLLPPEGEAISAFAKGLSAERWEAWMAAFRRRHGKVAIPRFSFDYQRILNPVLSGLGMEKAFAPEADFTGIHAQGGLSISEVRQKTYLRVDEAGTEAAAVTAVSMADSYPEELLRLNRPFVFAIRERTSGTLLFLGWVKEPSG